jgi:hypothetical protein
MYCVEALGLRLSHVQHFRCDDLQTGALEPAVDFTDQVLLDAVGFDDG